MALITKNQPHKIDDHELVDIVGREIRNSLGYRTGKLALRRQKALQYYFARPVGDLAPPEIEGRSSFVSTDVADTIRWMLPQLVKMFTASDDVVQFAPQKDGDEEKAKMATDYINYVFYKQNPGWQIIRTWFKDAMLAPRGIVKVWWQKQIKETREEYTGLSDIELGQLLNEEDVEVKEHSAYPDEEQQEAVNNEILALQDQIMKLMQAPSPPVAPGQPNPKDQQLQQLQMQAQILQQPHIQTLHDVTIIRRCDESQVCIANVPPEEFLISRVAKSTKDAPFMAHQVLRSLSYLRSVGYKNVDDIVSDDTQAQFSMERIERALEDDEYAGYTPGMDTSPIDPSQRMVWISECYLQIDMNGDGIAEWRKVVVAGNTLLENEEIDAPPFFSICADPTPHRFNGESVADMAIPIQQLKTSVIRSILDNLYLQVNGRYFAVEGQVNLDDLLTSRPGGVVRVKQPNMVGRLDQGMMDASSSYQMIEYAETMRENRTGWTRYSQGQDADALNPTATGVLTITQKGEERIEMIAREFAETGVSEMFRYILQLITKHQDKEATINVSGRWVPINPADWEDEFDLVVNVGLGTGNREQRMQHLQMLAQNQAQGMQIGIATPDNLYNTAKELTKAMGFKAPEMFFTDPKNAPPKPPQPDPEQIKAQAAQQLKQMDLQADQQKYQAQVQQEQQKFQAQAQIEQQNEQMRFQHELALKQMEIESAERIKAAEIQSQNEQKLMELAAGIMAAQNPNKTTPENLVAGTQLDQTAQEIGGPSNLASLQQEMQNINAIAQAMSQPQYIVPKDTNE